MVNNHCFAAILLILSAMAETIIDETELEIEQKSSWCTNGGDKHNWIQWHKFIKHCRKYRCVREGCGFFKKCWTKCDDINCKGCHVIGHKRW